MYNNAKDLAVDLCGFIDTSPTPFHAVYELSSLLRDTGFTTLHESDDWNLVSGGRYLVTRNGSAIAAFVVGGSEPLSVSGFKVIGAHTDSPNLQLKPNAGFDKAGYAQLAVEPYGGLLLASWLNRDLSIAGRVVARSSKNSEIVSKLVKIDRPLLSLPQLAIHLDREVNDKGVVLNKQTHTSPIFALTGAQTAGECLKALLHASADLADDQEIIGMDLSLFNVEPSAIGGLNDEFIYAPRLDNLASCHIAMLALVEVENPTSTCVVVLYDNEEVGSQSAQGALSPFLKDILERLAGNNLKQAVSRSFCISADMAHAVHPNYTEKHEPKHSPVIGKGPVIKTNVNQRYASTGVSTALFVELCKRADVPYQNFVSRSDLACGTTIGPITAAELGICTVDVGSPMLSMHSIREQAGVDDHFSMFRVLRTFFDEEFSKAV